MLLKGILVLLICLASVLAIEIKLPAVEAQHDVAAYEFHYAVHDPHTGDIKSQKETRQADKVEGVYELIDSDGHRRIVQYKADDHSGFEAIVQRVPTDIKIPLPEPVHEQKLIGTKILTHAQPLLTQIIQKPALLQQQHEPLPSPTYGNFVAVSRPNSNYKY